MSDLTHIIAHVRRLYHHTIHGGTIKPHDLAIVIADLEAIGTPYASPSGARDFPLGTPTGQRMWDMTEEELRDV